jgi:hypothetical protein
MLHDNIKYDNLLSFYFVYEIYSLRCVWDLINQIRKIDILHLHDADGIFLPYLHNIDFFFWDQTRFEIVRSWAWTEFYVSIFNSIRSELAIDNKCGFGRVQSLTKVWWLKQKKNKNSGNDPNTSLFLPQIRAKNVSQIKTRPSHHGPWSMLGSWLHACARLSRYVWTSRTEHEATHEPARVGRAKQGHCHVILSSLASDQTGMNPKREAEGNAWPWRRAVLIMSKRYTTTIRASPSTRSWTTGSLPELACSLLVLSRVFSTGRSCLRVLASAHCFRWLLPDDRWLRSGDLSVRALARPGQS